MKLKLSDLRMRRFLISKKVANSMKKGERGLVIIRGKLSILRMRRCPISKKSENGGKKGKRGLAIIHGNSGPTPVARGGCGVKAPPLAARLYCLVVFCQLLRLLRTNI